MRFVELVRYAYNDAPVLFSGAVLVALVLGARWGVTTLGPWLMR